MARVGAGAGFAGYRIDPAVDLAERGESAASAASWLTPPVLSEPARTVLSVAKAARVLAALKRDGWTETRRSGSHRLLVKGAQQRIWAYHDGVDLGGPAMARIARTTAIPLLSFGSYRTV